MILGYEKFVWGHSRIVGYAKGKVIGDLAFQRFSLLTGNHTIQPRFAFVDFTSIEHATAALIHPKNHQLDGRKLVVEYASADAVRRGGGAGHKPRKKSTEVHSEGHSRRKRRDSVADNEADEKGFTPTTSITTPSKAQNREKSTAAGQRSGSSTKSKVTNGTRTRKSRPAPGAALALAKREQVAIVPSQGRRITFDD